MNRVDLFLQFSQGTGIYQFMNSVWGWPIVESLHFIGLCMLLGTVGVFDLRMLGLGKGIALVDLHKLVPIGVAGYLLNLVTGIMFFTTAPDQYLFNPAVQTKFSLMILAGINVLLFYTTTVQAARATTAMNSAPVRAKIIATVSLACWCGVIICGRLITYYRPPYHWCIWC